MVDQSKEKSAISQQLLTTNLAKLLRNMASVLRQVEYYFSDHSWPFDDYLKGLAASGTDGFVDLSVIAGELSKREREFCHQSNTRNRK
jgi:hypothetical protein